MCRANCPRLREILGDDGVYFPAGDAPALTAALADLAADPARAARLSQAAAVRATAYTYLARAGRVLDVLRTVGRQITHNSPRNTA